MKVQPARKALSALVLGACFVTAPGLVSQSGSTAKPPARVRTAVGGFELSQQTGKSPNQIGGASRDLGKPTLYAPVLGKSYTLHPHFYWSSGGTGDTVNFKLTAPTGEVLYQTSTSAEFLVYPDDAPSLSPGTTYKWTIVPENDLLGGKPPVASFTVVAGPEREETAHELSAITAPTSTADVYIKHHDWYDAVQVYSSILKQTPADQNALASRAMLYDELPVTAPLASADRAGIH